MGQPITIGTGMFDVRQEIKKPLVYGKQKSEKEKEK